MSTSTCTAWARLISQDPDQPDILFPTRPNEPKCFKMKDEWIIYQSPQTSTVKMANFSPSKIRIDFTWLKQNEEQMLCGGEVITFYSQNKKIADYIFVLMRESKNNLKRNKPLKEPADAVVLKKSTKVQKEEDIKEKLVCSICLEILYKPVSICPCSHRYCSGCLSKNIEYSTKCPICREEILSFQKHSSLDALIDQVIKSYPSLQRSEEDRLSLDGNDLISKGYQIIRDEDGVYFGQSKDEKKHGEGKMTYEGGMIYQGNWKDGKREGKGTATAKRGSIYEGEFSNGFLKKSNVKITFTNGNVYSGEIEGPLMHGKGILSFQNGDQYRGEFVKGKKEGIGAYFFQNGDRYIGNFVNQVRDGYGKMEYANGDFYEGNWNNDQKDGEGAFKYSHGLEFRGFWKNNEIDGEGKFMYGEYVFKGKWEKS